MDRGLIDVGDFAPWFRAPVLDGNPAYTFDTVGGRFIVMLFMGSAADPACVAALATMARHNTLFDDLNICFFGVTRDLDDARNGRIRTRIPGIRHVLDGDGIVTKAYGAQSGGWFVLDRALRVIGRFALGDGEAAIELARARSASVPSDGWAPVLEVPDVLDAALCRQLIDLFETGGHADSAFMRQVDGKTRYVTDHNHKQRRDHDIKDAAMQALLSGRVARHLKPAIRRAFQFEATRIERWIVSRYDADAGHFRPHRDNTTPGTAHRRFAVTINLNAGDYTGGDLRFPEFGPRTYRAPTGGAIVFSCSLLHEATPVTAGQRYAFLPFLYDEEASRQREANNALLGEGVPHYTHVPSASGRD
jgi:predicted 2-oxoglutarate/Fe(II)-dependent dioxygenase YbiX/peroxiredoxin